MKVVMDKPWELKVEDKRSFDTLFTFIIFCEDENSEPIYFKSFENSKIKVNTIGNSQSMYRTISKAIDKCVNDGILMKAKSCYELVSDGYEIWCVYDRDFDEKGGTISGIDFNLSIETANKNSINVAWSNDAFELWILLHLFDISNDTENYLKRTDYYLKLKTYFENHSDPNEDLIKVLHHKPFYYKKHLKSKNNFKNIVLSEIKDLTDNAINNAKKLEKIHASEIDFSKKIPCTMVHKLVISLIEKSK